MTDTPIASTEYNFEPRIPFDHLGHLVAAYKAGSLLTNKGESLMCCGSILGEIGSLVTTFESPTPIGASNLTTMDMNELVQELEETLESYKEERANISPYVIALIVKFIELALEQLKK